MSGIHINPSDYLINHNHWDLLVQYLEDNASRYHFAAGSSREDILEKLKCMTAESFKGSITTDKYNPGNLLERALTSLFCGDILTISRDNLLRLILALGINKMHNGETSTSLQEANRFLLHYMHESELSARNLRECIFIWAVHNNLPTKNIVDLIHSHKKEIDNQPLAPTGENYDEYRTDDVLDLLNEIGSRDQFESFIRSHHSFFTKLGNTHYCCLFDDIRIVPATHLGKNTFIMFEEEPDEDDRQSVPRSLRARAQSDRLQRERYYSRLFGLYTLDEETYDNHLDADTVQRLTRLMPDVFLTEDRFVNLLRRNTGADVPYGVYLLHMLIDMPAESFIPARIVRKNPKTDEISTVDPVEIFKDTCDYYLNSVGFASMNPEVPIDRLVLDVYRITASTDGDVIYKDRFFYNFREAFKTITDTCTM